ILTDMLKKKNEHFTIRISYRNQTKTEINSLIHSYVSNEMMMMMMIEDEPGPINLANKFDLKPIIQSNGSCGQFNNNNSGDKKEEKKTIFGKSDQQQQQQKKSAMQSTKKNKRKSPVIIIISTRYLFGL
ncbi:hypothetical protein DERP_007021, partial [Dermatophagoides pteronyssinus]